MTKTLILQFACLLGERLTLYFTIRKQKKLNMWKTILLQKGAARG